MRYLLPLAPREQRLFERQSSSYIRTLAALAALTEALADLNAYSGYASDLLKDRDPPDASELRCFDLIRRFHRWGRRDSIHGLRLVTAPVVESDGKPCLSTDGQPVTRRYVWELACF